jgi:hypothetical protein
VSPSCVLCGPRPAGKHAVVYEELCGDHQWWVLGMVTEEYRRHPDGRCTATCGCISLEELDRRLRWNVGRQP